MKVRNKLITIMLVSLLTFSLTACGAGKAGNTSAPATQTAEKFAPIEIKFANQHPSDSIASQADREICEEIEKATEGRVKVKLYTDSSLGDYTAVFEEVMLGTIGMAHITAVESYDPRMSGSMLPYLGSSYAELGKAYSPEKYLFKTVFDSAQKLGIRTFGFFCEGFSGVGVSMPLTDANLPGKDKGALVRVPGLDNFSLPAQDLGFRTSTIAYADTYTAIQTGVVNGWVGGPPNLNYQYFRDVIKYYYHYQMTQEATQILMSEKVYQSLLPEDQEAITKIIQSKCQDSYALAEADDAKYMKMMSDMGIEVIEFTDEERSAFAESCRKNVWPSLAKNTSQEFIDSIVASLK